MNKKKFDLSLDDTSELKKLIIENPELPLLVFCGEDAVCQDYSYSMAYVNHCLIQSLALYNNEIWMDKEDYTDRLRDDLCDKEEYENLSDEEYDKMIEQKVAETEFVKAIVIFVG